MGVEGEGGGGGGDPYPPTKCYTSQKFLTT